MTVLALMWWPDCAPAPSALKHQANYLTTSLQCDAKSFVLGSIVAARVRSLRPGLSCTLSPGPNHGGIALNIRLHTSQRKSDEIRLLHIHPRNAKPDHPKISRPQMYIRDSASALSNSFKRLSSRSPRDSPTSPITPTRKPEIVTGISASMGPSIAIGSSITEIHCHLSIVSLQDSPCFEALSYVWGDPHTAKVVILDGHEFPVTANLHLALTHLQRLDKERVIWIDALCIDQGNVEERTS